MQGQKLIDALNQSIKQIETIAENNLKGYTLVYYDIVEYTGYSNTPNYGLVDVERAIDDIQRIIAQIASNKNENIDWGVDIRCINRHGCVEFVLNI